ncbi:hypothetical protein CEUSTIGMA_g1373.t1 [Chlamydomonas eustigma]|uniref:Protein kinase domain-containing protein n=1 Tax=Chlamydomonas eustigma TaxID=1157962 RepID=A0A250WSX8_9CHLO|nr:hypothetical protein CEUSTIGMA_g1373.t1 [Chlamydomonas eustigma]|eukprot:GAX73923.1 hypothetical protein CEUSTIGMA_g1373.t1 [Chlamydomonas eustigma]
MLNVFRRCFSEPSSTYDEIKLSSINNAASRPPVADPVATFDSSPFQAAATSNTNNVISRGSHYPSTMTTILSSSQASSANSYNVHNGSDMGPPLQGPYPAVRPEELLMLQPMENMGLLARPASLHLQELNREITNLQKIGQGAGGIVYRGLWTGVNVAVKFMKSSSPEALNLTAKEAILSRFVSHPNVVQTFTYDVTLLIESAGGVQLNTGVHNALSAMPGIKEEEEGAHLSMTTAEEWPQIAAQSCPSETDSGSSRQEREKSASTSQQRVAPTSPDTYVPTKSLAIFDPGSRSIQASAMSQIDTSDSTSPVVAPGWDMQDVLLRLGAMPGEYLTHIIMELCDEGTLLQAIPRKLFGGCRNTSEERSKLRSMLKTAREIAAGMQHLHSLGIIHGDLKPGNVLLKKEGSTRNGFVAKVGDFGLAQRCGPGAPVAQPGGVPLGTLCYAAPEALRGILHKSSDVYSFGIMFWQMCTGEQPFQGMHPAHILYGKQTNSLQLQWPAEVYSPIRKLGELCSSSEPVSRPTFDQVCKALVQIELRMHRTKAPAGGVGTNLAQANQGLAAPYTLMPDPDLLI